MILLRGIAATVCCFAVLSLAGLAGAGTIPIQVAPGSVGDDPTTWNYTLSYLSLIPEDHLSGLALADEAIWPYNGPDAVHCIGATACTIALDPSWAYLVVESDGFVALFWLDNSWGSITIDSKDWNRAPIGGYLWPGAEGMSITSVRAAYPNPEPASALLFTVGGLIVGTAARRRARRSSLGD